jgi:hypothetical protein
MPSGARCKSGKHLQEAALGAQRGALKRSLSRVHATKASPVSFRYMYLRSILAANAQIPRKNLQILIA